MATSTTGRVIVTNTVIELKQTEPNKFVANEVSQVAAKPDAKFDLGIPINFTEGPFIISGSVDVSTMSISVNVKLMGFNLGTISGDLNTGVVLSVNLIIETGSLTFHLTQGNTLTLTVALSGVLNESKDINIATI